MAIAPIDLSAIAAGTGGFVIHGRNDLDYAGMSVSSAGDVNGDGFDDILIGAHGGNGTGTGAVGDAYVVFGAASGFGAAIQLSTIAAGTGGFPVYGQDAGDQLGVPVAAAGDINGDGIGDLILGARFGAGPGNTRSLSGESYVVFGTTAGFGAPVAASSLAAGTGGFVIHGADASDRSGRSVASAGDVNGDGLDDLIIGAYRAAGAGNATGYSGESYVVFGRTGGFGPAIDLRDVAAGTGGFVLYGQNGDDRSGGAVASAGDVNGDGFDDLLIGAVGAGGTGKSYVVFGKAGGFAAEIALSTIAAGTGGFVILGRDAGDAAGNSVASAGDVNGDGFGDLIISGSGADGADNTQSLTGESYVVFGQAGGFGAEIALSTIAAGTGGFVIYGEDANDVSGRSVASAGDVNGDGFDDLIIGASGADGAGNALERAGGSYVVFGKAGGFAGAIHLSSIAAGTGGFVIHGQDWDDGSGISVASAGDVDGDGFDDLIVGAYRGDGADDALFRAGDSYVIFGRDFLGGVTHQGTSAGETLTGTAGADDMVGGRGADTLLGGGGADVLIGGAGDDVLSVAGTGFARAMGGSGTDTLALAGAGMTLDLSAIADVKLQEIERIDLTGTGANTLVLSVREVLNLSSGSNTLRVLGDAGDEVVLGALDWTHGADAGGFSRWSNGQAVVEVASGVSIRLAPVELSDVAAGTGGFVIHGEGAVDQAGWSVASAGDVNGDGFADLIIGAPTGDGYGDSYSSAGDSYVVFGTAGGFGAAIELSAVAAGTGGFVLLGSDVSDQSGFSVAAAGDVNGDGFGDLVIGAPFGDGAAYGTGNAGKTYVVFGHSGPFDAAILLSDVAAGTGGFVILGQTGDDQSGRSVASAGDVNGDGLDDLIIGAEFADAAGNAKSSAGDTYVVFGQAGGFGAAVELSAVAAGSGGFVIHGQDAADQSGASVASAGDLNGDGFDDLVIGATSGDGAGNGTANAGGTYVVFGTSGGFGAAIDLAGVAAGTGGFVIHGEDVGDQSGTSVASAGDVNGDGFADLIIGAADAATSAGDSYVVFGASGGFGAAIELSAVAAGSGGFVVHGRDAGDELGYAVAGAGDVNADGIDDLIVSARLGDGAGNAASGSGESYVVFGRAGGFGASVDLAAIAGGTGGFVVLGEDAYDQSGFSVASAGDVDGDGFDDLIIGARFADGAGNATDRAGDSYVIFGRDFLGGVTHQGSSASETLTGTAGADDMVGGRGADTLVGGGGADVLIGGAGDDVIRIADTGFARAMGGSGTDTLALAGAGITLDLSAIADVTLQDIERIDLTGAGNNTLRLTAREVLNLSSTGNALRVTGDVGDAVAFDDSGWVRGSNITGFTTWSNGQASLEVASGVSLLSIVLTSVDLADVALGSGGFVIMGRNPGDQAGRSVASAGDINGDGFDDIVIGAPFVSGAGIGMGNIGDAYVVFGQAGGFAAEVDLTAVALGTGGFVVQGVAADDRLGFAVASAGDVNGDGFADLLLGALGGDGGYAGGDSGKSYVLFGTSGGFAPSVTASGIPSGGGGFVINGVDTYDFSGRSVASAGDINGDGFDDLIIGASGADGAANGAVNAGDTYVVFGKSGTFGGAVELSTVSGGFGGFVIHGEAADDQSGRSVSSAGDVNGDGLDDLLIGAPYAEAPGGDAGKTYVVFGRTGGFGAEIALSDIALGSGGFVVRGRDLGDISAFSVATAGDVNGDGFADIVIGARDGDAAGNAKSYAGESYVVFGTGGGFSAVVDLSNVANGTGGFAIFGQDVEDTSGWSVASAGDLNGDGFDDLVIGARYADAAGNAKTSAGDSYVVFGRAGGFGGGVDLAAVAAGTGGFVIHGQEANDRSGVSVASAGDVDGDGFDDLIVGASYAAAAGNTRAFAGESYVIFGRDFLASVSHAGSEAGETLTGTAGADNVVAGRGDDTLAGNGGADVLIGGGGDDVIRVSGTGFARAMGGTGTDTLALDGAGLALDLEAIADTRLQEIERIDLTGSGNNSVRVTEREVLNLSSTGNALRVDGNAGDVADLAGGGWVQGASSGGYTLYTKGAASVSVDDEVSIACFAEGTRIRTLRGEVAVEALTEADTVVTRNGARRVRWIGHRTLEAARHPRPWDVQPVRVAAGAFGPGLPVRDLWLSPDHAVFTAGALIPVRYLLNGATVVQETVARVTYFHVELSDDAGDAVHDVMLAEGLTCESFLDTGNKGAFANGGAAMMLHPDFALQVWAAGSCAPLVREGGTLLAVRAALGARAAAMGWATTDDPDLCLVADGREITATWDGDRACFTVPAGARAVRLRSRSVVPAQLNVSAEDHRRLGVAVTALRVDGCAIGLDDAMLAEGWHAPEDGLRWTDGDAILRCGEGALVDVSVALLERYWTAPARPIAASAA